MYKKLTLSLAFLITSSYLAFPQAEKSPVVTLQPNASESLTETKPGSNGLDGPKPYWVNFGLGFIADENWKEVISYRKEAGNPKAKTEGTAFAIGGGINVHPYVDLSLEYFQSPNYIVEGKKGDQFSYKVGSDGYRSYQTFDRSRKIKVLSYSGVAFGVQGGYTYQSFRFFGGLSIASVTGETELDSVSNKKVAFATFLPKLGVGYFIGDFFPYFNLSSTDTIGVRYYF